ncbi:hypothetical protein RRG08_041394 [Elysia crispata]|uniref:Uncharacterized protein n=1 Tax=Elysia crispata TaxID=231223 RepID=A0AAE1CL22_9GAST|nr:hypothetical protein RRG08_041394 [Elysia crispata]
MRTCRVTTLVILFLPVVFSRFFKVPQSGQPCILLDANFTVQITAKYRGNKVAERILTADEVEDTSYSCDLGPTHYIQLNFLSSNVQFKFSFTSGYDADRNPVKLAREFTLTPSAIFPHLEPSVGTVCFKRSSQNTGTDRSSYLCSRKTITTYDLTRCRGGIEPSFRYTYGVAVDMKTIQTQAYDIQGNVFSPPEICGDNHDNTGVIVGSVLGAIGLVAVVVVVVVAFVLLRRKRASSHQNDLKNHVQKPDERSSLLGSPSQDPPQTQPSA